MWVSWCSVPLNTGELRIHFHYCTPPLSPHDLPKPCCPLYRDKIWVAKLTPNWFPKMSLVIGENLPVLGRLEKEGFGLLDPLELSWVRLIRNWNRRTKCLLKYNYPRTNQSREWRITFRRFHAMMLEYLARKEVPNSLLIAEGATFVMMKKYER